MEVSWIVSLYMSSLRPVAALDCELESCSEMKYIALRTYLFGIL